MDKYTRISTYAVLAFAAIFAVVIGSRIDQQTISVLAGTVMGFLVASITVGGIAYMLGRRRGEPRESAPQIRYISPMPQTPPPFALPQYFQPPAPGSQPYQYQPAGWGYGAPNGTPPPMQLAPPRRFFTIGSAGSIEEMSEVLEQQERGIF